MSCVIMVLWLYIECQFFENKMHTEVCKGEITWHLGFVLKWKFDNFEFVYWEYVLFSAFDMSENFNIK